MVTRDSYIFLKLGHNSTMLVLMIRTNTGCLLGDCFLVTLPAAPQSAPQTGRVWCWFIPLPVPEKVYNTAQTQRKKDIRVAYKKNKSKSANDQTERNCL